MSIHILKTILHLIKAVALHFFSVGNNAIASRGEFNVVLSGGSSPKKLYELLASPENKEQVNWEKVNFSLEMNDMCLQMIRRKENYIGLWMKQQHLF